VRHGDPKSGHRTFGQVTPKSDSFRTTRQITVILGLVPRIGRGTVLVPILGLVPRMTLGGNADLKR